MLKEESLARPRKTDIEGVDMTFWADHARTTFTTPAQQSGTRCQMNLEIQTVSIVLNGSWRQFSLAATSVTSALEVFSNEMRYIKLPITYLLTYLQTVPSTGSGNKEGPISEVDSRVRGCRWWAEQISGVCIGRVWLVCSTSQSDAALQPVWRCTVSAGAYLSHWAYHTTGLSLSVWLHVPVFVCQCHRFRKNVCVVVSTLYELVVVIRRWKHPDF